MSSITHILKNGFAICGQAGLPSSWPDGHKWVSLQDAHDASCVSCVALQRGEHFVEREHPELLDWPDDGSLVDFAKLIEPLVGVMKAGYFMRRRPIESLSYKGYNIGQRERATCLAPDDAFKKESLERAKEQGRDLLDVVLQVAFQLGVEQGRRHEKRQLFPWMRIFEGKTFHEEVVAEVIPHLQGAAQRVCGTKDSATVNAMLDVWHPRVIEVLNLWLDTLIDGRMTSDQINTSIFALENAKIISIGFDPRDVPLLKAALYGAVTFTLADKSAAALIAYENRNNILLHLVTKDKV